MGLPKYTFGAMTRFKKFEAIGSLKPSSHRLKKRIKIGQTEWIHKISPFFLTM